MQEILSFVAWLACPAGMGLMMWMMGRGSRRQQAAGSPGKGSSASLQRLRDEHQRLGPELDRRDERQAS